MFSLLLGLIIPRQRAGEKQAKQREEGKWTTEKSQQKKRKKVWLGPRWVFLVASQSSLLQRSSSSYTEFFFSCLLFCTRTWSTVTSPAKGERRKRFLCVGNTQLRPFLFMDEDFSSWKVWPGPLDLVESRKIKSEPSLGCGGARRFFFSPHTSSGENCLSFSGKANTVNAMYASPSNTSTDYFEVLNPTLSRRGGPVGNGGMGGSEIVIPALSNNI